MSAPPTSASSTSASSTSAPPETAESSAVSDHQSSDRQQTDWRPFDRRRCINQRLHFAYARQAFATANLPWSNDVLTSLHIIEDFGGQENTKANAANGHRQRIFSNTALLISDENPYAIKFAVFQGDSKATMLDQIALRGSAIQLINDAMVMFNENNTQSAWPQNAFREALVNAVIHRDYRYSGPILVSMFDQRIEVVSLGGLVEGLEVNDLLNGICQPRNAWFAEALKALHFNENFGTGIPRIMDSYAQSAASPQLRVGPSSVVMVLPKPVRSDNPWPISRPDTRQGRPSKSASIDSDGHDAAADHTGHGTATRYVFPAAHPPLTSDAAEALTGSRVIGVTPLHTITLSPDALQAPQLQAPSSYPMHSLEAVTLHLLAESGVELSRSQIERRLGISKNQAAYVLRSLVSNGQITRHGRSRATQYSLN